MTFSRLALRTALAATLALSTHAGLAQDAAKSEFKPEVGQAGKDVVWVPTPQSLVDLMLDTAKVTAKDYVMDLGSGDGRTVITAAKRGATAVGIEYNPDMVALAQKAAKAAGMEGKASFMKADLFQTDLSKATVITMFLLNDINMKLRPKILDLKPGTRVVSNTFRMGEWEPDQEVTATKDCPNYCTAYYWLVPAKVGGGWSLEGAKLELKQEFQKLSGTLSAPGKSALVIANAKMRGAEIVFTAGGVTYTGRVSGNAMEGTTSAGGKWKAARG